MGHDSGNSSDSQGRSPSSPRLRTDRKGSTGPGVNETDSRHESESTQNWSRNGGGPPSRLNCHDPLESPPVVGLSVPPSSTPLPSDFYDTRPPSLRYPFLLPPPPVPRLLPLSLRLRVFSEGTFPLPWTRSSNGHRPGHPSRPHVPWVVDDPSLTPAALTRSPLLVDSSQLTYGKGPLPRSV